MKAMILAAGKGERLYPLTKNIPKPLLPIENSSLIEHLLEQLKKAGIKEVVINLHYLADQIKKRLKDGKAYGLNIYYSDERDEGCLNTGGAILHALPLLGKEPFLVVSADIWTDFPFSSIKKSLSKGHLAHLVLTSTEDKRLEENFRLTKDRVHLGSDSLKLIYANIGVFRPEIFLSFRKRVFSLREVLEKGVKQDLISGETYQGVWYNVGTPDELQAVTNFLKKRM